MGRDAAARAFRVDTRECKRRPMPSSTQTVVSIRGNSCRRRRTEMSPGETTASCTGRRLIQQRDRPEFGSDQAYDWLRPWPQRPTTTEPELHLKTVRQSEERLDAVPDARSPHPLAELASEGFHRGCQEAGELLVGDPSGRDDDADRRPLGLRQRRVQQALLRELLPCPRRQAHRARRASRQEPTPGRRHGAEMDARTWVYQPRTQGTYLKRQRGLER